MQHRHTHLLPKHYLLTLFSLALLLAACTGASGGNQGIAGTSTPSGSTALPAARQVLTFPDVGTTDLTTLDPALGPDQNSAIVTSMLYTGLVKTDQNLNVVPDQASWQISSDGKTYTFTLKPDIAFSDGTPVTAQTYVESWTRAFSPSLASPLAPVFAKLFQSLTGVKALDAHTLQVTLTQPTPYFLAMLTNPFFVPLNMQVIKQFGQKDWPQHIAGNAVGTGPLMVEQWQRNVKMTLVPNPHYYGNKTRVQAVDIFFIDDPVTAFKTYRAGQYDLVWGMAPVDMPAARGLQGFTSVPLLQTDALFFDTSSPPFDKLAVRQAFAYALDKQQLAHAVFVDSVAAAPTLLPPGMPGYQANYRGLPFDPAKARSLLHTVYPDVSAFPPVTFSYPSALVNSAEAATLQSMWQSALGIQVNLHSVEMDAYNQEVNDQHVQLGFTQWSADFPDPYDCLTLNLSSNAANNVGQWHNAEFDQLVAQAETLTGEARLALYAKAERVAITDVGWLPLDHQAFSAVISTWVHGVTLNANGLYFGDWSNVYLTAH